MKKITIYLLVMAVVITMVLTGMSCKVADEAVADEAVADEAAADEAAADEKKGPFKIAWVPSVMGIPYFNAEHEGFVEALEPLGDEIIYIGPEKGTSEETLEILNNLLIQKVDGINFVPTDPTAQNLVCDDLREAGVKIVENASTMMLGHADMHAYIVSNREFMQVMVDSAAELMNFEGEFGVVSAASTSALQIEWIKELEDILKDAKYSKMKLLPVTYGDELIEKSYNEAMGLVKSYPDIKLLMPIASPAATAVGKFITDEGLIDEIAVVACGLPSQNVEYITNTAIDDLFLWDIRELGYFNALVTRALITGEITGAVGEKVVLGKLGEYTIQEENRLTYGKIIKVTKDNIDQWKDN